MNNLETRLETKITLDNCKESLIQQIGKIVGISLAFIKRENIKHALILRDKYDDFIEIINFINNSGRNNINPFLHKVKKEINKIKSKKWYKNIDMEKITSKRAELIKLKTNTVKNYSNWGHDMKYFLSIDIRSANYTVLKEISNGEIQDDTWSDYLKRIYPNDTRTERSKNINEGKNGLVTKIPDCIYESKWFRQFILSDLKKLQVLWEIKNLNMLKQVHDLNLINTICVNSDEVIIFVDNYDEADKIVKLISPDETTFRVKKFQLKKIDGSAKNCMLKIFDDNSKVIINCKPEDYNILYKTYVL